MLLPWTGHSRPSSHTSQPPTRLLPQGLYSWHCCCLPGDRPQTKVTAVLCRIAEPVCKAMASKDLKQRPGTVKRVADACLALVELEQAEAVLVSCSAHSCSRRDTVCRHLAGLQAGLIGAFGDRVPKAVQAAVEIITQAVRSVSVLVPAWL